MTRVAKESVCNPPELPGPSGPERSADICNNLHPGILHVVLRIEEVRVSGLTGCGMRGHGHKHSEGASVLLVTESDTFPTACSYFSPLYKKAEAQRG